MARSISNRPPAGENFRELLQDDYRPERLLLRTRGDPHRSVES